MSGQVGAQNGGPDRPGARALGRRTVTSGALWSVPVIAVSAAAPAFATSGCVTPAQGNMSGAFNTVWSTVAGGTITDANNVTWLRFDVTATLTHTWSGGVVSNLVYVAPFMWAGPTTFNANGPWSAMTWSEAEGLWISSSYTSPSVNDADESHPGAVAKLTEYQSSTPMARLPYSTYTTMPDVPAPTTQTVPGSDTSTFLATDTVPVIASSSAPITFGQTRVIQYSMWVEQGAGRISTKNWGYFMGDSCG